MSNSAEADQEAVKPDTASLKVLVIDDEKDLAEIAGALLDAYGIWNIVAHSSEQALAVLASGQQVDAIFSDILMPGMNGVQLATKVREAYPAVRIVLTSGYAPPGMFAGRGSQYQYIQKPYDMQTVIRMLLGSAN
jgi:two-component system OmpR family response regulator